MIDLRHFRPLIHTNFKICMGFMLYIGLFIDLYRDLE